MKKKAYSIPEVTTVRIECDIITFSYNENEEWTGPEADVNGAKEPK